MFSAVLPHKFCDTNFEKYLYFVAGNKAYFTLNDALASINMDYLLFSFIQKEILK